MQKTVQSPKNTLEAKVTSIYFTGSFLAHCVFAPNDLSNWDKSDKIFKQIILVTSKAEEKIQKLYSYYFDSNSDENVRSSREKDPPRRRRVIKKNANQNYLS